MSHIPTLSSQASAARVLRVVRWVRWILPLGLVAVAAAFEWSEHVANEPEPLSTGFAGEIIIFALIGPIAVAITLWWLGWLLAAYVATSQQLADANRGLEAAVADRTRHLSSATDQLAEANTELAAANDELRKLDQMKSEFVALVSHQLRAPLTNIIGALELVAQDADRLPASSQRTLQILTKESHRLSRLIRTILEVSRLEAGRLAPRLGAVAIDPLLSRTAASTLDPDRPWALAVPHGLPPVWADEVLLEEVVRNLLENAALYSPRGASVDVTAAVRDGSVEIAVVDHGPGIPVDERELVFSSFHRIGGDDATADGYGLGLYFAHKLLVAQGGTIRVESPAWPDENAPGSRFVVTLPLAGVGPDEDDPEGSA